MQRLVWPCLAMCVGSISACDRPHLYRPPPARNGRSEEHVLRLAEGQIKFYVEGPARSLGGLAKPVPFVASVKRECGGDSFAHGNPVEISQVCYLDIKLHDGRTVFYNYMSNTSSALRSRILEYQVTNGDLGTTFQDGGDQ